MSEATAKDPLIGTVIADRYRVDEKVGDGGMGAVYRVEHTHMRKRLALKVLHHDLCAYPEIVARFEREAMAAANIEHPNVASATDFGKLPDGSFYLVLEYVEGIDLRQLLQRDKFLNPARAVHISLQILGALGRAHELGIVHRDLKPENILLVEKDGDPEFVKVLDFGIARVPVGSLGTPSKSGGGEAKPLTRAGTVYGTPEYMAPEQALGHQVDGRADVYALGILLFEMLAGARPFDDPDKIALLGAHVSKPIPRLSTRVPKEQFIPEGLESVVTKALAKQPEDRYQNARELSEDLLALGFDAPMPITRHPSNRSDRGPDSNPSSRIKLTSPSPAPARTETQSPKPALVRVDSAPVAQPAKSSKLPWAIAVLSIAGAAGAIFYLRRPHPNHTGTETPTAQASTTASAPPAPIEPKEQALRALGRIASGEVEAGVKELEALAAAYPSDPSVLRAVAQAYDKAKRPADAVSAIKKLVAASPDSASDPLLVPILENALADAKASDEAVSTMVTSLGATGSKLLYDTAFNEKSLAGARARANRALRDPKTKVPAGVRAAYELRTASTCPAKKAVLDKHKKDFDALALPLLQAMQKPTCGANNKQPCWGCITNKELDAVVKDVESRTKK
jgi:eukaryotic-like serine/threonine-protein kinase